MVEYLATIPELLQSSFAKIPSVYFNPVRVVLL